MKKIFRQISVAGVIGALIFSSCKDEVVIPVEDNSKADSISSVIQQLEGKQISINTELNTITIKNQKLEDSISKVLPSAYASTKVQYTVNVISLASAWSSSTYNNNARTTGLENATVTLTQNGSTISRTTEGGIAVFAGLNPGTVTVTVAAPDHTTLDFTANLQIGESTGDVRNAGTQVYLFPNGATNGGTITGKAYANRNAVNDTLGRRNWFGTEETNSNYGKYFSKPSVFEFWNNNTQYWNNYNRRGLYDNVSGSSTNASEVNWELAPEGHKIYIYPSLNFMESLPNNYGNENPGYITEYTYRNVIKSTAVGADGSFTVSGIAVANIAGNNYSSLEISTSGFNAMHKRFTTNLGNDDETGSVAQDYTLKDNSTLATSTVNRRTIEQNYYYTPTFVMDGDYDDNLGDDSGDFKNDHLFSEDTSVLPGQSKTVNILFFPIEKR